MEQLGSVLNGIRSKYEGMEERNESKIKDESAIFAFNVDDGMRYDMVGKGKMHLHRFFFFISKILLTNCVKPISSSLFYVDSIIKCEVDIFFSL